MIVSENKERFLHVQIDIWKITKRFKKRNISVYIDEMICDYIYPFIQRRNDI